MTSEYIDRPCLYGPPPAMFSPDFESMPLCSQLKAKLAKGGEYYAIARKLLKDDSVTVKPISRQLHFYRNGKKFLILTGRSGIKTIDK